MEKTFQHFKCSIVTTLPFHTHTHKHTLTFCLQPSEKEIINNTRKSQYICYNE